MSASLEYSFDVSVMAIAMAIAVRDVFDNQKARWKLFPNFFAAVRV